MDIYVHSVKEKLSSIQGNQIINYTRLKNITGKNYTPELMKKFLRIYLKS